MTSISFRAPAIHCAGCAASIKRSLSKLSGIQSVDIDIEARRVDVVYDTSAVTADQIAARLELAGFPAEPLQSD